MAICIHWFNPLVYLMVNEINRTCELSCDEIVIRKLDISRRAYGDTLLNALAAGGSYKESIASVTLAESKELLKERLDAIMNFKKKSKAVNFGTLFISCLLLCGFVFTGSYAASPSNEDNKTAATEQATSYVIDCKSENIIVKQEGTEFKVEVEPGYEESYMIRDNTNVPMNDRYYIYSKWDIIFQRKDKDSVSAKYSPTVTVTIPERGESLLVNTETGNIQINSLNGVNLTAESTGGDIFIADSDAEYITIRGYNKIDLKNINSKTGIRINWKEYDDGDYTIGNIHFSNVKIEKSQTVKDSLDTKENTQWSGAEDVEYMYPNVTSPEETRKLQFLRFFGALCNYRP